MTSTAPATRPEVAVIGGGITGLVAAYEANRLGARVTLLEASPRLGGKVHTEQLDGFLVETGPDSFVAPKRAVLDLVAELGIEGRVISPRAQGTGARVWWDGRLHPLPEGLLLMAPSRLTPLFRSSLLSWRGKLRILGDLVMPAGTGNDESLASFVTRRLGREVLERIAEPLVAGIHAAEPETMSLEASFPRFLDMERRHRSLVLAARNASRRRPSSLSHFVTLRGGMGELTAALEGKLGSTQVKTGTAVGNIARQKAGRYRLITERGGLDADGVILATPARITAHLLKDFSPTAAELIDDIRQVSTATVTLAYRTADTPPLAGSGFVVPAAASRRIMGVSYLSNKWDGRVPDDRYRLLRAFVGGANGQHLALGEDARLVATAREELAELVGITAHPILTRVGRWPGGLHQYTLGHIDRVRAAESSLEHHPNLAIAGAAFHGIGLNECVTSGRNAARKVTQKPDGAEVPG